MADEIDITADLVDGSDGALGDVLPVDGNVQQGAQDAQLNVPDGAVDANKVVPVAKEPDTSGSSIRDQLSNAFKGEEAPVQQQEKPQGEVPQLTKDDAGKYRQPDGTFASAEQITAFEAAQQPPPVAQQQAQWLSTMTPIEQEQYRKLPEETRQFVERTMEAVSSQAARFGEYGIIEQQLIGPRREAWAQQGMSPAVAMNNLFNLSDFASTRPSDFVLWFAEQNKVDLDALLDARDLQQAALTPEMRNLQGQVQQLQNHIQQSQTQQQQQQYQQDLQRVQTFALEKDEAGALRRPYLTEVNDAWAAQIQALRAANPQAPVDKVLQQAYENACWANPAVRQRMQEANLKAQQLEAARKVEQARLAGSSVQGAPGGGAARSPSQQTENLDIRSTLKAAFAEHAPA